MEAKIQWRQDTIARWTAANPVLGSGEAGLELDSVNPKKWKLGDNVTPWNSLPYQSSGGGSAAPVISGSRGTPVNVTAVGGITPPGGYNQLIYLQGSGGSITITKNPQIASGVNDGELLELRGRNDLQTVTVSDGNGLSLNGSCVLGANCSLWLRWDTSQWVEVSRRDN